MHLRVDEWLNPWRLPARAGPLQLSQAWYSLGTGGVGGTGLGFDHFAGDIPELTSDMIFAAIGTEMGLVGAAAVVVAFILLVGSGFRVAQTARSDFSRLMSTGLTLIIGFQAFFIMAGVVRLLPFTGITLPFVAYGGSSLLANYILIALLLRISDEGARQQEMMAAGQAGAPGEKPMVPALRRAAQPARCYARAWRTDAPPAAAVQRATSASASVCVEPRVASVEPTRMSGKPTAMPTVKGSPSTTTPSKTATAGLT